jgi:hypothetical protein
MNIFILQLFIEKSFIDSFGKDLERWVWELKASYDILAL